MDKHVQQLMAWNSTFVLMGGAVVCTGCMKPQSVLDSNKVFPHAKGCKHDDAETRRPWDTLHSVLDAVRG